MMPDIMNQSVKTPAGEAPAVPVIIIMLGAYLTWFGIHYWRSDTKWPTDPLKAVLTGKEIPVPANPTGEAAIQGIVSSPSGNTLGTGTGASPGAGALATTMTKDQIKALWTGNGGNPATANLAAAVAMQESSGRVTVTSPNPDGGTNVGLWQLDTKGVGAGHTIAELSVATTNARITIMATANGTKWSHWEAYTSGDYKKYL